MMRWRYRLSLRLCSLFSKNRVEQELAEELRFHLERQMEQFLSRGMTADEARSRAPRELGGVDQIKEQCWDMRGVRFVEDLCNDVRYSLWMMAKVPGVTMVVVLSLALGIGANTAIFTLTDAVMLKSLPVERPNELV